MKGNPAVATVRAEPFILDFLIAVTLKFAKPKLLLDLKFSCLLMQLSFCQYFNLIALEIAPNLIRAKCFRISQFFAFSEKLQFKFFLCFATMWKYTQLGNRV